jgi:acyl-coenzyme A thioesterase PaaI-like protein
MSSANADHPPLNDRIAPDGNSARTALPAPNFSEKVEAWLSRMSMKSNFMQKAFSSIWLPYAFRSGLTMKRVDDRQFVAVLPFRRFNRNWYNAMAGAALLGNSEVAGGLYLFGRAGSDYVVVCKEMHYRFLRPCYGPAMYEVMNSDDLDAKIRAGGEFNIPLEMEIRQHVHKPGIKAPLVGKCSITFHCTPKAMIKAKLERRSRK